MRVDQRSRFLADAKKSYRFKSMKMVREISPAFPPVKKGRGIAALEFTEIQISHRLKSLKLECPTISGTLRPAQDMASAISEEIAKGESNPQPPHPYMIPNYHERPWLPRITAHITAYHTWKNKTTGSKKQAISLQMRLHHHMRFIMTAEMCSLWTPFGGIAAQLNHIAVLLSLETLESAGFAIRYRELLIRTLADHSRTRLPFDYFAALSEVHEDTRRTIATDSARASNQQPQKGNEQRSAKGKVRPRRERKASLLARELRTAAEKRGKITLTDPLVKVRRNFPPLLLRPLLGNRLSGDKNADI